MVIITPFMENENKTKVPLFHQNKYVDVEIFHKFPYADAAYKSHHSFLKVSFAELICCNFCCTARTMGQREQVARSLWNKRKANKRTLPVSSCKANFSQVTLAICDAEILIGFSARFFLSRSLSLIRGRNCKCR